MADTKLSALTELATTPAVDDEVYIRDVSEVASAESKRITIANLFNSPTLATPAINGIVTTTGLTLPAFTLGGTVTLNGKVFDAGSGDARINTTKVAGGLAIQSTQNEAYGATLSLYQDSASPAVDDIVGYILARGKDNANNETIYGYLGFRIENVVAATKAGKFFITLRLAAIDNLALTLSGAGALWTDLSVDTLTYKVSGTQVVSAQGAAVANATDATSVILRLNELLARCRTHGLIAT